MGFVFDAFADLFKWILSLFRKAYRWVRKRLHCWCCKDHHESRRMNRRGGLQRRASLTSMPYEDFAHSSNARHLFLIHTGIYYSTAVLFYSFLISDWRIVDSLYFATILFTTIGYGDLVPDDTLGRMFTICLLMYGIAVLGIFLGIAGESLVEDFNEKHKQNVNNIHKQVVEVMGSHGALTAKQARNNNKEEENAEKGLLMESLLLITREFSMIAAVLVGGQIMGYIEGWSWTRSLYWTVVSATTVGFGDEVPQNENVRFATIFFLPFSVAVFSEVLGQIVGLYLDRKRRAKDKEFLSRAMTLADLETMDTSHTGRVEKSEFLSYMLVALQRVSREDLNELNKLFEKLDRSRTGYLSKADLQSMRWNHQFTQTMRAAYDDDDDDEFPRYYGTTTTTTNNNNDNNHNGVPSSRNGLHEKPHENEVSDRHGAYSISGPLSSADKIELDASEDPDESGDFYMTCKETSALARQNTHHSTGHEFSYGTTSDDDV